MIDIKQGDCLELMKEIPDKSIDMILCDFILINSNFRSFFFYGQRISCPKKSLPILRW